MTLSVTVIVALLMLIVLGYSFNQKDGKIQQGGLLQFESRPSGATVTLDEIRLGSRTNTKTTVDVGDHTVMFNLDRYRTWQKSINIKPGQIGWLSYARLIPTTIEPETLHAYTALHSALAAPSRNYMLLHEAPESPEFTLVNLQGETLRYDALTLPATSYTTPAPGKSHSFVLESWSQNDQAVLIRHHYDDDKTEWILLDRSTPERSVNVSAKYAVNPSRVVFAGSGDELLFVQVDDIVRRINLNDETLSRPLATEVDNFTIYDDKTITYATRPDDKGSRTVGYASMDIDEPVVLASFPADGKPLLGAMATYFNERYVITVHGQKLTIRTGDLPKPDNKGKLKEFASREIPEGAMKLLVGRNSRLYVVQLADGYATYDVELKKYDKTTWAYKPAVQRDIRWLDDYMVWSDYGGQLRFYEFDGANQQNIMPVAEGYSVTLSPNDKYVYGIAKTDNGYELRRAQLLL